MLHLLDCYIGMARFELTHDGVKVRCLTAWLHPIILCLMTTTFLKKLGWRDSNSRVTESKSVALPLGYIPLTSTDFMSIS